MSSYQSLLQDLNSSDYISEEEQLQMLQTRASSDESISTITGLFYGCLLEENNFDTYFCWITSVVRDNYRYISKLIENVSFCLLQDSF